MRRTSLPVLIVAGGAGGIGRDTLAEMRPLLAAARLAFEGTVISWRHRRRSARMKKTNGRGQQEDGALFSSLTVAQNIEVPLKEDLRCRRG